MDNQISKYHGLINQGATGYLNSLLQVLYMTADFKLAVERFSQENPDSRSIDHELNDLFNHLKTEEAKTDDITKALSIDKVFEQRDAAEYFERILLLANPSASKIFNGILTHRNTCSSCQTETETDSKFWHLPLALVNSDGGNYSVSDGVKELFRASYFFGDDQIYCDSCCAKSDFKIKCVMKQHPDVLLLLLKRFELDYSVMRYVKNNCNVDVPESLQIPDTNQTYELYAVINHDGDIRNGHYTATIRDDENWHHFNDRLVTQFSPQKFQEDTQDVYLLFYKKQSDCQAKSTTSCPIDNNVPVQCGDAGDKHKLRMVPGVRRRRRRSRSRRRRNRRRR